MSENIENLKNELVEKSAAKAVESTNETISAAKAELTEQLEAKASAESVEKLAMNIDKITETVKSFNIGVAKRTPKEEMFAAIKGGMDELRAKGSGEFSISTKDFAVSSTGATALSDGETMDPGIKYDPNHQTRLRNLIPTYSASAGSVRFNQESAGNIGAAAGASNKAKGAVITSATATVQPVITPIQTIMSGLTVPEENLSDVQGIQMYIQNRLIGAVMDREDDQILAGNGTAPNISGIIDDIASARNLNSDTVADTFFGSTLQDQVHEPNTFDVLNAVAGELEGDNFRPDLAILHPTDFRALGLSKTSAGEYQFIAGQDNQQPAMYFAGLRVVPNAAQTQGNFTVLDSSTVGYWMNGGLEFKFGYHTDDFLSNNITARVLQRGAVTKFRTAGIVTGVIQNAINSLNHP